MHLHPSAQRKLKDALLAIARAGDQVFINNHSSVLVADENELQLLFRVEKNRSTNNCCAHWISGQAISYL
ncbi:hypothetical protein [Erythrobacter sp. T5W1-R]|uniref:hypothetical protein n=1 Tax=Erythrobacter sp. T5W1-R TaxID=3101752 RepID=UPI003A4C7132